MVALADVQDVPSELLVTALVRARMCELLSGAEGSAVGDSAFTVGLFSLADTLADAPMSVVIEQLPLRYDVEDALLYRTGALGDLLDGVVAYQQGEFDRARGLLPGAADAEQCYRAAVTWADQSTAALS